MCAAASAIRARAAATRCTEPQRELVVRGGEPAAGRLFQFTIAPLAGSTACACPRSGTNPRQSCSPVPRVGSAPVAPGARTGRRPALYIAMLRSSA